MFEDKDYLKDYVSNGWHHMKWALDDAKQVKNGMFTFRWLFSHPSF